MGFRLPSVLLTKQLLRHGSSSVPKGYCAVYAGENQMRRFVIPVAYLNHPCFQQLLNDAEEEFGFHHSTGGLTIPCKDNIFSDLISRLRESSYSTQEISVT